MALIRFHLFGSLDLRREDGTEFRSVVAQPKRTAMLAYMACQPRGGFVRRDAVVDLFWPEMEEPRARRALTKSLHFLRQSLGGDVLRARGDEDLGLDPGRIWTDVWEFRAAVEGERWEDVLRWVARGELLAAFHLADAPGFERWLDYERDRVKREVQNAGSSLLERALDHGDEQEAVGWGRRLLETDPLNEPVVRRLMELLDGQGYRAGALESYQIFATRLWADLEVEPGPETTALAERIRARETPVAAALLASPRPAGAAPPVEMAPTAGTPAVPVADPLSRPYRPWRRSVAVVVAGLALALAVALVLLRPGPPVLDAGRLLVVALENRTGDSALDPLGEMAADWMARGLQQTGLAQVVDPLSAIALTRDRDVRGMSGSARAEALARGSGARSVLWGSYYRQADTVYMEAQVSDLTAGTVVLTVGPVAAPVGEPVTAVERLRQGVLGALAAKRDRRVSPQMAVAGHPPSYPSYVHFVEGLDLFQNDRLPEAYAQFVASFRADSTFYLALTWAAFASGNQGRVDQQDSVVGLMAAGRDRLAPLERYAMEYFQALRNGERGAWVTPALAAARLSPGSTWSYNAARGVAMAGRVRAAVALLEEVDGENGWPGRWVPYWRFLCEDLHLLGDDAGALEAARRIRSLAPDNPSTAIFEVSALAGLGRVEVAEDVMKELWSRSSPDQELELHYLHAGREMWAHGHREAAARMWQRGLDWIDTPGVRAWFAVEGDSGASRYRRYNQIRILVDASRWEEVAEAMDGLAVPEEDRPYFRGLLAAHRGERAMADSLAVELVGQGYALGAARIWAMLGQTAQALEGVRSYRGGARFLLEVHRNVGLDPLRSNPGFVALTSVR